LVGERVKENSTMTALFNSSPVYDLPFTKGDDLSVVFVYKVAVRDDDGNPVLVNGKYQFVDEDYPEGATVHMEIDTRPEPTVLVATIDGALATVTADYLVVDKIPARLPWRVKVTYADGLDKVAARGKTVRND
jgi:hypothetical protein